MCRIFLVTIIPIIADGRLFKQIHQYGILHVKQLLFLRYSQYPSIRTCQASKHPHMAVFEDVISNALYQVWE